MLWIATIAAAGVTPRAADIVLELEVLDDQLQLGEALPFVARFHNAGSAPVRVAGPLDGSFEGMRDPHWTLEWLDGERVVDHALGFGPEGRCGLTNPLENEDVHRVSGGSTLELPSAEMVWMQKPLVQASARPGEYRVRLRYDVTDAAPLTPLSLVSNTVPVTITGGDGALWQCRADQLASRDRPVTSGGAVVVPDPKGGAWVVRVSSTEATTSQRVEVGRVGDALRPTSEPPIRVPGTPGWLAAEVLGATLVLARTPEVDGERVLELTEVGGPPRRVGPSGYLVDLARSGDVMAVAGGDGRLEVRTFDGDSRVLASEYAGFPTLDPAPGGFLVVWEAGSGQGRAQRLDLELNRVGDPMAFEFDGQTISAARAVDDTTIEVVFADAGYQGDDPTDLMGLYRQRFPGGTAEALSPTDREHARFGDGAWLDDGRFLRAFESDDGTVWAGAEALAATRLSTTGRGPNVRAMGDRFVVSWSDWRDDRSVACLELKECSPEGYAAVLSAEGEIVVPPTRLTEVATPRPVAPYDDWERFCRAR